MPITIVMPDRTEFTERTTTMAIDPPTALTHLKVVAGPYASLTLEALTEQLRGAEITAATVPGLRAELAERMAAMFPGQKLVRTRKAKGTP